MPYFSIYAPDHDHSHYYTITLIGYQRGLVVRWSPGTRGWTPRIVHLEKIPAYNGSHLEGYRLVAPESIDTFALESMTSNTQL